MLKFISGQRTRRGYENKKILGSGGRNNLYIGVVKEQ